MKQSKRSRRKSKRSSNSRRSKRSTRRTKSKHSIKRTRRNLKVRKGMKGGGGSLAEFVLFHSNNCGHCLNFYPTWSNFKSTYKGPVNLLEYEASKDMEIFDLNNILAYPTLRLYPNGLKQKDHYIDYDRARTVNDLIGFVNEKNK